MKIVNNNVAYLQKYYLNILTSSTLVTKLGVPISMFDVTNKKSFSKCDSKDFIKFSKKEEIKFLKDSDWIIDYNCYIDKDINEIEREIESIDIEGNKISEYFNSLSEEKKELEYKYLFTKAHMLMYKRESLNDILKLKNNNKILEYKKNNIFKKILRKTR